MRITPASVSVSLISEVETTAHTQNFITKTPVKHSFISNFGFADQILTEQHRPLVQSTIASIGILSKRAPTRIKEDLLLQKEGSAIALALS
jgi:hypothetical protein